MVPKQHGLLDNFSMDEDDIMNKTVIVKPSHSILPCGFSWQEWWQEKIRTNFMFFKAIEENKLEVVKDLLNK
jgi:hypothetical protein